jgi:hypothetical protein
VVMYNSYRLNLFVFLCFASKEFIVIHHDVEQ